MTQNQRKQAPRLASRTAATLGGLALGLGLGHMATVGTEAAYAKPCGKHANEKRVTRAACLKQMKRNRMDWPPRPEAWEIKRRIGWHWQKAERVARCETGGNWQHYPNGRYIGGLGMYRSTYGIGQAVTGYRWPHQGATKAEQIAVGYIVAQRFGWRAWGCGSA